MGYQKVNSWGLVELVRVKRVPRYPLRFSTFWMLARRPASTDFWTVLSSCLHLVAACLPSSAFLSLCSEAFLSSFLVKVACFLKKASSMLTLTPVRGTFREVEITQAGLILLRGTPLMAQGPVTRRFPLLSLLRTTTLLPRLAPERRMTTEPGVMDFLPWVGWGLLEALLKWEVSSSAGYQVLALFLSLRLGAPPRAWLWWLY